jgi:hypothetical protein
MRPRKDATASWPGNISYGFGGALKSSAVRSTLEGNWKVEAEIQAAVFRERRAAMKLRRANPNCDAHACILPIALAVLGFSLAHPFLARPQVIDSDGQSYYENAKPLLDYPLPDLLRAEPELQGLEPASSQDALAMILDKAGKMTEDLMESMPNLVSREEVTQEKLRASGKVQDHRRAEFDYMILVHRQGAETSLDEYRAGPGGSRLEEHGLEEGYTLTQGFASAWLYFLPDVQPAARFRYLGQQTDGAFRCYVVAFAQKPGWATITGRVAHGGRLARILYQGMAWIDEASFRIVRLRTDLLAPRPDIGLDRQTTELHLGETRLPQMVSPLWLPQEVIVTTAMDEQHLRNVHRYSSYRLFKVETKILPAPPDQPLPEKPN